MNRVGRVGMPFVPQIGEVGEEIRDGQRARRK